MAPDDVIEELQRLAAARPRRRLLPDGPQVELPARSPSSWRSRTTSSSTPTSPSRARSRTARSCSRVPFRFLEGCLIAAHAIQSEHVFIYIRGEYEQEFEVLRDSLAAMRKQKLLGDVTFVLHRGAGAYICGEETALLESLEGRRGQPRTKPPFPAIAGLYAAPTAVNNVESITTAHVGAGAGRRGVREARRRELDRDARLLALRQRRQRRQLRAAARLPAQGPDLRGRRRHHRRADAEGGDPRRLVDRGADGRRRPSARRSTSTRSTSLGTAIGSGRGDRDRRPLLHGAARHPRLAVLRARVVRQVHAVPCRHALADADPPEDRGRAGGAGATSICCSTSATGSSASASARSATRTRSPVASYVDKFRDEFQAHIDHGGCPLGGGSSLEGILAPVAMHAHLPRARVSASTGSRA